MNIQLLIALNANDFDMPSNSPIHGENTYDMYIYSKYTYNASDSYKQYEIFTSTYPLYMTEDSTNIYLKSSHASNNVKSGSINNFNNVVGSWTAYSINNTYGLDATVKTYKKVATNSNTNYIRVETSEYDIDGYYTVPTPYVVLYPATVSTFIETAIYDEYVFFRLYDETDTKITNESLDYELEVRKYTDLNNYYVTNTYTGTAEYTTGTADGVNVANEKFTDFILTDGNYEIQLTVTYDSVDYSDTDRFDIKWFLNAQSELSLSLLDGATYYGKETAGVYYFPKSIYWTARRTGEFLGKHVRLYNTVTNKYYTIFKNDIVQDTQQVSIWDVGMADVINVGFNDLALKYCDDNGYGQPDNDWTTKETYTVEFKKGDAPADYEPPEGTETDGDTWDTKDMDSLIMKLKTSFDAIKMGISVIAGMIAIVFSFFPGDFSALIYIIITILIITTAIKLLRGG